MYLCFWKRLTAECLSRKRNEAQAKGVDKKCLHPKMKRQPCVNGHSPSLLPSPGRPLSPVQKSFCLPWGKWKTVAIPWALPLESKHRGRESNPTPGLCFYRHFLRLLSHVSLFLILSIFYTNFPKTWTPLSLRWHLRRLIPAQLSPFRTSWWALILSAF